MHNIIQVYILRVSESCYFCDIFKNIYFIWYKIYTLCGYIIIYSHRVYIDQKFPAAGGKILKYMQF